MIIEHVKLARNSLRSNRIRTILTLLGIIIGVTSVTTIIGLGQGVKNQVNQQIGDLGSDLITVAPGRDQEAGLSAIGNILGNSSTIATLSQNDLKSIKQIPNVDDAGGLMQLDGSISHRNNKLNTRIIAVEQNYLTMTKQKLEVGQFFGGDLKNNNTTVLSSNVSKQLFGDQDPIGSSVQIRGTDFIVIGVLNSVKGFNFGRPINDMALIPMPAGQKLNQDVVSFQQITVALSDSDKSDQTARDIKSALLKNHSGEEDFTITTQDQLVNTTSDLFKALTTFTAAVASISLLVGGIGVMNIMFVTVTERTREIGIRKAVGATKTQILMQFLTEALVITLTGGIIGIVLSFIISYIIRSQTSIQPSLDPFVILLAAGVSVVVGVIFGTWPAIHAARKEPTEALRYE
jgi:ABC-type antimicrobial peptide transport system permease subunit